MGLGERGTCFSSGQPQENEGGVANPDVDALKASHGRPQLVRRVKAVRPPGLPQLMPEARSRGRKGAGPPWSASDAVARPRENEGWRSWMAGGSPRSGPRRRGYMRAGGHTSTRARQAAAGAAVRGFSVARVTFIFLSFCALVGSGAASDRPASAGRGRQERSVSSSP